MGSILGVFGVGSNPNIPWGEQNADFIKLQFRYSLLLKQKLASGEITQAYYDANYWLTTETLTPPYQGWWDEFKTAVNSEDLNWLAQQTGQTVEALTAYMGDALKGVAKAAGGIVGTAISATTGGLAQGFFGSLNVWGWLAIGGLGVATYYAYKKGLLKAAFKHELNKLIP